MATDARAFGISIGINAAVCFAVFLFFGFFRKSRFTNKFYAPKRYKRDQPYKPKRLPGTFLGWLRPLLRYTQEEVILIAGTDAAMFLRVLSFGVELFVFVTLWSCIVVLPTNLSGHEVDRLLAGEGPSSRSNFTYWIPPPAAPSPDGSPPPPVKVPDFYVPVPPAPPGLEWWHYAPDVPPLPEPATYFNNDSYASWGWRYMASYTAPDYQFSNLDRTTLSNIPARDTRLWVHLVSTWVLSLFLFRLLWRYNLAAVEMRIRFLITPGRVAEAHTIVVRDIPGIPYGTLPDRIDKTALRFLPRPIKRRLLKWAETAVSMTGRTVDLAASVATKAVLPSQNRGGRLDSASEAPVQGEGQPQPSDAKAPLGAAAIEQMPQTADDLPLSSPARAEAAAPGDAREELYFAAREYTVPVYGGQGEDEVPQFIGPAQAKPQTVEPGTHESPAIPTEMDAWTRVARQLAAGMPVHEVVQREFQDLFPGLVVGVAVACNVAELEGLWRDYEAAKRDLVDLLDHYISLTRRNKRIKRKKVTVVPVRWGAWGVRRFGPRPVKVDALQLHPERLRHLAEQIRAAQAAARNQPVPAGFVTFRLRETQVLAATAMVHHDQRAWHVGAAPGPEEIIWPNLGWRGWERAMRTALIWAGFWWLAFFYLVPVGAVQALLQVSKLESVAVIRDIVRLPVIDSIVTAILPTLVLRIFLALLPALLSWGNRVQGMISASDVDFGTVQKYFIFQVITVFFASFIVGSLFNQLQQFIRDPGSIITILGTAAPQTAIFFTTYLLTQGLIVKPISQLRIFGLIVFRIRTLLAATERAKARLWANQQISYGSEAPDHVMAILLGLVFCVIMPLIAPVALVYFLVNVTMYKYQLLYVYTSPFQSGGRIWRYVFNQIITAAFLFQLVMLALFGLKKAPVQAGLMVPLLALTVLYARTCLALFARPQEMLSLRAARDLDRYEQGTAAQQTLEELQRQPPAYEAPVFRDDSPALERLLAEAEHMAAQLDGNGPILPFEHQGDVESAQRGHFAAGGGDEDEDTEGSSFDDPDDTFYPASSRSLDDAASSTSSSFNRQQPLLSRAQPTVQAAAAGAAGAGLAAAAATAAGTSTAGVGAAAGLAAAGTTALVSERSKQARVHNGG